MTFSEILRQALSTFRAHKMRTFLTMFGIVWGISSVILLVGLGRGFVSDQKKHMETLGKDLVIVWGGRTSSQAGGLAAGREIRLNVDDAELIRDQCYLIQNVSPELRRTVPEVSQFNEADRGVVGMWPSYQDFRSLKISEGRLISEEDEREGRRVLILGSKAYRQLFPGQPAVGATVLVKSVPYLVVGVLEEKKQNSNYSGPDNDYLFAPYSSVSRDFPPPEKPGQGITRGYLDDIVFEVANPEDHEEAVMQVRKTIGRMRHFDADDKDALFIWDTMDGAKEMANIFNVVTLFFGCVAIVTLCLGGIGVMNIMLVSVTERTREIGTRKAMGATKRDILRQFFAESAMLTTISGILGLSLGIGICIAMTALPLPDFVPHPIVSSISIVASILTLSLITVTAGMYPAQRAAEMTPVESLRHE
ncbi:MAG TPA: ABC transporter permease [Verrucomicrobiae bacterium]|jgi:putative ABC transport system permease protein|nr:ABC transporter permease [Verrucomicrobiae bacterium]